MLPSFFCAQQFAKLSGVVKSAETGKKIAFCTVFIEDYNLHTQTDENGKYVLNEVPIDKMKVSFMLLGYEKWEKEVNINQPNFVLNVELEEKAMLLGPYEVEAEKRGIGSIKRMRSIEGVFISEGKKNEVIDIKNTHANKATNQSRQIYSRIPGLNIWESDGAGIQLGIGGRGLNPSRTSNFNTRQNGYDISADALGYPESYYTPPSEAVKEIQLIRGAASLQFGTQFGGLLNFVLQDGPSGAGEKLEVNARQTLGSFDLGNTFLSVGAKKDGWKTYGYFQHKQGKDWRPNSQFDVFAGAINVGKYLSEKAFINLEYTKLNYLAQQPGGLTDEEFYDNPYQSKRSRNWFAVDWNLAALNFNYEFTSNTKIKSQIFGLYASRKALGNLGNISRPDNLEENRNLIAGEFQNFGNETRLLHIYKTKKENPWAFLMGVRAYKGFSNSTQGAADSTDLPNFTYVENQEQFSDYEFPSTNYAAFAENIFRVGKHLSITPGVRYEYITTNANGSYNDVVYDLAGNVIFDTTIFESRTNNRGFVIGGIGMNYKVNDTLEIYTNFSQNYRSINFTDMQIQNKNFRIDPDLQDETGFNADLGVRGYINNKLTYDVSAFVLMYNNRIGDVDMVDETTFIPYRLRTNVSKALVKGVEAMAEIDWWKVMFADTSQFSFRTFVNLAVTDARYIDTENTALKDKKVEFVPPFNFKTGVTLSYKNISAALQYTYVQEHFSDATNAGKNDQGVYFVSNAIVGVIPSYSVMDLSLKLKANNMTIETGVNNLTNEIYFTRRATGYPGPGIIPASIRNYYLTLAFKL